MAFRTRKLNGDFEKRAPGPTRAHFPPKCHQEIEVQSQRKQFRFIKNFFTFSRNFSGKKTPIEDKNSNNEVPNPTYSENQSKYGFHNLFLSADVGNKQASSKSAF